MYRLEFKLPEAWKVPPPPSLSLRGFVGARDVLPHVEKCLRSREADFNPAVLRTHEGAPLFGNEAENDEVLVDPPSVLKVAIAERPGTMKIFVRTLTGKIIEFSVLPET